jgi:hypothetical protein
MKSLYSLLRNGALHVLACLLALAFVAPPPLSARGDKDWKPIDPAQLALAAPAVEKDTAAEALFWEVKVADEADGGDPRTVLQHYVRIKIFNDRGRESQSKIDIFAPKIFGREVKISDIAARTIKPDGTIIELKKEDIFERTVPAVFGRGGSLRLSGATRKYPVVIDSEAFTETVRFKLPEGFDVDEVPDAVKIDSDFGNYTATYEIKDGHLVFTRTLVQHAATIPSRSTRTCVPSSDESAPAKTRPSSSHTSKLKDEQTHSGRLPVL